MRRTDWRDLYASNRAVIERAHGLAGLTDQTIIAAGQKRRALVHTPADGDPGIARPLVCMLHGCTQDAATFAAATRMNDAADRHGFMVVYPQQERGENAQRCWNWFDGRHQARGAGEPASIAAVVRDLVGTTTAWTVDSDRVFVAGLSAGGAMAAVLAAAYPDLFAAVAVHSGLAYKSAAQRAVRLRGDGARRPQGRRPRPARPEPRHPRQRRPDRRPGQRRPGARRRRWRAPSTPRARPRRRGGGWRPATPTSTHNGRMAAGMSCTSG